MLNKQSVHERLMKTLGDAPEKNERYKEKSDFNEDGTNLPGAC